MKTREGFTLTELLVVTAVIAILASLLLPALAKGKSQADYVTCLNNQRQLYLAWNLYAHDNADWCVPNFYTEKGGTTHVKSWVQGAFYWPDENTRTDLLTSPDYALFAPYIQTTRTYLCPPATRKEPKVCRHYAMNCYFGIGPGLTDAYAYEHYYKLKFFAKLADTDEPSRRYLTMDFDARSVCWPMAFVDYGAWRLINFPASYHNRAGAIAFADGHVEKHRWQDKRTIAAESDDYHGHDYPAQGSRDLVYLREIATSKVLP